MTDQQTDIDWIVRRVIERITAAVPTAADDRVESSRDQPDTAGTGRRADREVPDRVISLETLQNRLDGAKTIQISTAAVVTPAARDELRRRGVTVTRTAASSSETTPNRRLLVAEWQNAPGSELAASRPPASGPLVAALERDGCQVQHLPTSDSLRRLCLTFAADSSGPPCCAILLTERPATAVCRLNRQPHLRAALGHDPLSVQEAIDDLDANVLVVNPSRHSLYGLQNLIRPFVQDKKST